MHLLWHKDLKTCQIHVIRTSISSKNSFHFNESFERRKRFVLAWYFDRSLKLVWLTLLILSITQIRPRAWFLIDLRLIKSNNLSILPQATTQFIKKAAHSIKENFKNQKKYHIARRWILRLFSVGLDSGRATSRF